MKKAIIVSVALLFVVTFSSKAGSISVGNINPNNRETQPRITNQAPVIVLDKTFTAQK